MKNNQYYDRLMQELITLGFKFSAASRFATAISEELDENKSFREEEVNDIAKALINSIKGS